MVFWLCSKVLEDALFPESLHQVPIFHNAMSNGVLAGIAYLVCFISNEEVWSGEGGREGGGGRREGRREGGRVEEGGGR